MIKQSIMFLLVCLCVTCQPVSASFNFKDRQELFLIQSCLMAGSVMGNTDVIYYWNNKLVDYASERNMSAKQYQDTIRYTRDLFTDILNDNDRKDVIATCIREAGGKI